MKLNIRKNGVIQLGNYQVDEIIHQYGSPLYLYDELTLRNRCREMKSLCDLPGFQIHYSAKANTSIALMKIIRDEGIGVDAMSLGEVYLVELAGYNATEILFVSNNVSRNSFHQVSKKGLKVCIDSLDQLRTYGEINPGSEVYIRLNPPKGAGHHNKVITAGKVKFGIEWQKMEEARSIAKLFNLRITGLTVHIGSLFLDYTTYHETVILLLDLVKNYSKIDYIDFGGGFGIPYDRKNESPFPIQDYSNVFTSTLEKWMKETGRNPTFAIQPGRYLVAECGICLTSVHSTKVNNGIKFVGTDLGFNNLLRPEMYGAYHEIIHATKENTENMKLTTVVGNICESGDILGKDRILPATEVDDILIVKDTGAYGFCMASNYNSMLRPPELLLGLDGEIRMIRKQEPIRKLRPMPSLLNP